MSLGLFPSYSGGNRFPGLFLSADGEGLAGGRDLPRILVVDDDDHVRLITVRMLQEQGYQVFEAESGKAALALLHRHPDIRVAVVDLMMPEMSGETLADQVRELAPGCAVVFMTGFSSQQTTLGEAFPDVPLLLKPFTPTQLIHHIKLAAGGYSH